MSNPSTPSFSRSRRWLMRLNFFLGLVAVVALLVMTNYLSGGYFKRVQVGANVSTRLSPQTLRVLGSLTNDVTITIFFNPEEEQELYSLTSSLLAEYHNASPKHITVSTLDYVRFDAEARQLVSRHNLQAQTGKNFVLFECNGRSKVLYSRSLADYNIDEAITTGSPFRRNAFRGEMLFTSSIFAISNPGLQKAYFLSGHGERDPQNNTPHGDGYSKFANALKEELNAEWQPLSLEGINTVPADCRLLIVAGPRRNHLLASESAKIDDYLKNHGGRMLLLLDNNTNFNSGFEDLLGQWGLGVSTRTVRELDKNYALPGDGTDFMIKNLVRHPTLDPINAEHLTSIRIANPRYFVVKRLTQAPGEAVVKELAFSSEKATDGHETNAFPLIVAAEQGVISGVSAPQAGGTRLIAIGDADLFSDSRIDEGGANHTFASLALTWLMDRPEILLNGLVPHPIKEYKLIITESQSQSLQLLFLAGIPGLVMLIGGLIWLRRRR